MKLVTNAVFAGILLTGVASVNSAVTLPSYNFADLHVLQKFSTSTVTGINNAGQVTGMYTKDAWVWENSTVKTQGLLNDQVLDMSEDGKVLVSSFVTGIGIWDSTTSILVNLNPSSTDRAVSIASMILHR